MQFQSVNIKVECETSVRNRNRQLTITNQFANVCHAFSSKMQKSRQKGRNTLWTGLSQVCFSAKWKTFFERVRSSFFAPFPNRQTVVEIGWPWQTAGNTKRSMATKWSGFVIRMFGR